MNRQKLDDQSIEAELGRLPGWARDGDELVRTYRCQDFRAAVALIGRIAEAAEAANHHPDLCLRGYRNLEIRLTSHDAGGITARDVNLAEAIDKLAADASAPG